MNVKNSFIQTLSENVNESVEHKQTVELIISFANILSASWRYHKNILIRIVITAVLSSLLTILMFAFVSNTFTHLGALSAKTLQSNYLPVALLVISASLLGYINALLCNHLTLQTVAHALPSAYHHLLTSPLPTHTAGELTQTIADYDASLTSIIPNLISIIFSFISLFLLFIFIFYLNTSLGLACLLLTAIFLPLKLFISLCNNKYVQAELTAQSKSAGFLSEAFLQIIKIRAANAETSIFKKWFNHWLELKTYAERTVKLKTYLNMLEILLPVTLLLFLFGLTYFSYAKEGLKFIICSLQFTQLFEKFTSQLVTLHDCAPALKRLSTLLPPLPKDTDKKITLADTDGNLDFHHVTYQDANSGRTILNDINLTIREGEFIGIIGASGAGKSTLFKMLLGLVDISSGHINLDQINIKHIDSHSLRKQFGVVLQNSQVFPGSIYSNLTLNHFLTLAEAWLLAEQIGLADDVRRMPMQMHTYISDNAGETLSGGQKQKILLGRALAAKPKILLLDEATSALDTISEAIILRYLASLKVTRVVIAHRQATLTGADRVYALQDGRLKLTANKGRPCQVD